MTTPDLLRLAREAPADELPVLVGILEQAKALAWARLTADAARPPELRLLTVEVAAELARLPRRRIFSLARSAPWALRVGRRLLVEESAFRKWLDSCRHVPGAHETARQAPSDAIRWPLVQTRAR